MVNMVKVVGEEEYEEFLIEEELEEKEIYFGGDSGENINCGDKKILLTPI